MKHILTVDLEEWFHCFDLPYNEYQNYESRIELNTYKLLEVLNKHGIKATFFVLADIARQRPHLIHAIRESGHEISSHGLMHQRYSLLSDKTIRSDILTSINIIADIIGKKPEGFRCPCFSITQKNMWILDYLSDLGLKYDSSIFPLKIDRYGIQGQNTKPHIIQTSHGRIWEFPITPAQFSFIIIPYAGGAYFRIVPFPLINLFFNRATYMNEVVTFYIHPWEMDANQPNIISSFRLKFTHYYGLNNFEKKLTKLFSLFSFGSIGQYIDSVATSMNTIRS